MTIAIQLDASRLVALELEAAVLGVTLEQLATDIIDRHIRTKSAPGPTVEDTKFKAAMEATFRENDELYRRLAK